MFLLASLGNAWLRESCNSGSDTQFSGGCSFLLRLCARPTANFVIAEVILPRGSLLSRLCHAAAASVVFQAGRFGIGMRARGPLTMRPNGYRMVPAKAHKSLI